MDPITVSVVTILGKYALDKGAELGKAVGPEALDTAREMFGMVLERVREKPRGEFVADEFESDPETYEKPMAKKVEAVIETDPDFAAELKALVEDYDEAVQAHAAAKGTSYDAILKGSGALAQGKGAVAASGGSVAVGGSVGGSISTGSGGASGDADEDD
jgi:uncharacterized membrane protein YgcG